MKILFWVPYPTGGASNRYRVEQYLPYLKKAGISYSLHSFWNSSTFKILYKTGHRFTKIYYFIFGTISRLFDLLKIFQYDIVFIHREAYPIGGAFFEIILAILRKPFIFDFDVYSVCSLAVLAHCRSRAFSAVKKFFMNNPVIKNPPKILAKSDLIQYKFSQEKILFS